MTSGVGGVIEEIPVEIEGGVSIAGSEEKIWKSAENVIDTTVSSESEN